MERQPGCKVSTTTVRQASRDLNLTENRKEDAEERREKIERLRHGRMKGGMGRFVGKFADQIAYLRVHSRAVASYRGRSVL